MACNASSAGTVRFDGELTVKVTVLSVVLVLVVAGNALLYVKMRRQNRKWIALLWLLRTLAIVGILNGVVNIGTYIVSLSVGNCQLGEAFCQVFGVVNSVLISSWTWVLAIAASERLLFIVIPSEHMSMFSEVNTRIMTWGVLLLLVVLFLSPIYGWGEYSFFRGKLDVLLTLKNYTLMADPPEEQTADNSTQANFYQLFMQLTAIGNLSAEETIRQIPGMDDLRFRRPAFSARGISFPVRIWDREMLQCLWDYSVSERLSGELEGRVLSLSMPAMLKIRTLALSTHIEEIEYRAFKGTALPYQETAQCGLDYTGVNNNIYSFVGLSWVCSLLVPFCVIAYSHARVMRATRRHSRGDMLGADGGVTRDDTHHTRALVYASVGTALCDAPYFGMSLAAGLGAALPPHALFAAHVLLFASWCLPGLMLLCTSGACCCADPYAGVCACNDQHGGCCPLPLPACSVGKIQRARNRAPRGEEAHAHELEVKRSLLSSVASSSNSPVPSVNKSILRQRDMETIF